MVKIYKEDIVPIYANNAGILVINLKLKTMFKEN